MGKSSSSSKKIKHSRDSSKLRLVKKKKKTKRNKSKKIRRIKDYSDESESSGSDSSLYSSSEDDDYRRKKKRGSKVSKKRSRKRYSSSESESDDDDDDDDTRLLKKKKRSKRKDEHVRKTKKKKISSKKRRKRDLSSSSTSSESCSIWDNRSDDDCETDGKRSRDSGRRVSKVKASQRISRDESEGDSEPDECWQGEDEVIPEENPRRLKSIVVVSCTYDNDERVDDHDDLYVTHRDNIDSGNRELRYNVESDEIDGETTISYSRTPADDNRCKTVGYDDLGENNTSEKSKSWHIDNSLIDDDLEAILKKRALENLKRFRGVTQRSGIARKEVSSVSEGEPLQIESEKVEESRNHGFMELKLCDPASSKDLEASEKLLQVGNVKESGTALASFASQQDRQSDGTAKVKVRSGISSCTTKRKLVRPVLGKESLNLASRKEGAGSQDAEVESINDSTINIKCPETENGRESIEPINLSSHADSETLDELKGDSQSEQKTINETKDESQYEQKTMTVMRGGEMVQVSYKVYIPKKTSSLGRRKLKR